MKSMPGTSRSVPRRRHRWALLLAAAALTAAVWTVYRPVLGYGFTNYDEQQQVVRNPLVRGLSPENLGRIFTSRSSHSYYPVRLLSYAVDHAVWGMDPTGFHLTNLLLHTANVLLLAGLILRLVRWRPRVAEPAAGLSSVALGAKEEAAGDVPPHRGSREPSAAGANPGGANSRSRLEPFAGPARGTAWPIMAAALGAAGFALHPVAVEPVAWIAGREELLMVFGALGCLHLHLSARRREAEAGRATPGAVACHLGAVAACIVACGSNVVGAVVPALVTVWDVAAPGRPPLRRAALAWAPLWAVGIAAVAIKALGPVPPAAQALPAAIPLARRPGLVLHLFGRNVLTLLRPADLTVQYRWEVPEGSLEPGVLLGLGGVLALAAAMVLVRRHKVVLFGLGWFVLALAPVSQLVLHHIYRADRLMYLPLAGLMVAAGAALAHVRHTSTRTVAACLTGALLALWGVLAVGQVPVWRDSLALFERAVRLNPESGLAHYNYAGALAARARHGEAVGHYKAYLRVRPEHAEARGNLGASLAGLGRTDAAIDQYRRALEVEPLHAGIRYNLANALVRKGRSDEALAHYRAILETAPDAGKVRYNLALALARTGDHAGAVGQLERLLADDPDSAKALAALARVLATSDDPEVRDPERAVQLAERACERTNRTSAMALGSLATAYAADGRVPEAIAAAEEALEVAEAAGEEARARRLRRRLNRYHRQLQNQDAPRP